MTFPPFVEATTTALDRIRTIMSFQNLGATPDFKPPFVFTELSSRVVREVLKIVQDYSSSITLTCASQAGVCESSAFYYSFTMNVSLLDFVALKGT